MNFFFGQESLSIYQWVLRGLLAYFFMLIAAKIMGQRSISQLRLLDFAIALVLGNIIAHPLSDEKLGMTGAFVTSTVLVVLYFLGVFLSLKSLSLRNILESSPVLIIKDGKISEQGLARAKISIDLLLSELRKHKIAEIKNVSVAFWEPGGTLSVFLESQFTPVTPSDLQIQKPPFVMPVTLIKEGKIDRDALHATGKDENWLILKVNNMVNSGIKNVLLATYTPEDNLYIILRTAK